MKLRTYDQIIGSVRRLDGRTVKTCWIAEVKRELGLTRGHVRLGGRAKASPHVHPGHARRSCAASMTRDANAMVEGKGSWLTRLGWWVAQVGAVGGAAWGGWMAYSIWDVADRRAPNLSVAMCLGPVLHRFRADIHAARVRAQLGGGALDGPWDCGNRRHIACGQARQFPVCIGQVARSPWQRKQSLGRAPA